MSKKKSDIVSVSPAQGGSVPKKPSSNLELMSVPAEEEDHRTDKALKDAIDSSNCNGGNNNNVNGQVVLYPETSKDPEVT